MEGKPDGIAGRQDTRLPRHTPHGTRPLGSGSVGAGGMEGRHPRGITESHTDDAPFL